MTSFPSTNKIKNSTRLSDKFHRKILESVSMSLASTFRNTGPKVYSDYCSDVIGGCNNPDTDIAIHCLKIYHNLSPAKLYEHALLEPNTKLTSTGALTIYSGIKTGRSPKDKRIVCSDGTKDAVWWGNINIKMDHESFNINRETATNYLNTRNNLYVFDGFAGWDKKYRIRVRLICEKPYHALFIHNMLIRPTIQELEDMVHSKPDFTIYNAGTFPCNRFTGHMSSSTSIDISFDRKEILILGTQYAGEMKKGIFSVMHFLMPPLGVLSLHSSANYNPSDTTDVSIFFGLSGTGKTTLSSDSNRILVGDDEHCWTDDGIFNIEGGCYAKCINLDSEKEKEIFEAIKFGTLLENINLCPDRSVDYSDISITQNTRAAYPIEFIKNIKLPCVASHPKNIIFLTCDGFGVLPIISKLNPDQALYHFVNGYTSKIAGTEVGLTKPEATFSSCFGEAFLTRHPMVYAELLKEKMIKYNTNVWLINTGWIGGGFEDKNSYRCPLKITRGLVDAIHQGALNDVEYEILPLFDLMYPKKIQINDQTIDIDKLDPSKSWKDDNGIKGQDRWLNSLSNLKEKFNENYKRFV